MANVGNWVLEQVTTVGTGIITLRGEIPGFASFASAVPAGPVWYSIEDNNGNREVGIGDFDGTDILVRTTVKATLIGSAYTGDGATPINLSGNSVVSCTFSAETYQEFLDHIEEQGNPHNTVAQDITYDPAGDPITIAVNVQNALVAHALAIEALQIELAATNAKLANAVFKDIDGNVTLEGNLTVNGTFTNPIIGGDLPPVTLDLIGFHTGRFATINDMLPDKTGINIDATLVEGSGGNQILRFNSDGPMTVVESLFAYGENTFCGYFAPVSNGQGTAPLIWFGSVEDPNVAVFKLQFNGDPGTWEAVFTFNDGVDNVEITFGGGSLTTGNLYHFAFIITADDVKVYLDGAQYGASEPRTGLTILTASDNCGIGGNPDSPYNEVYDWDADRIAFYSRALDPSEIDLLYNEILI